MLLEIDNLSYTRRSGEDGFRVEIAELRVAPGEIVALTGESGSGKSTALELMGLVARPETAARFHLHANGRATDVAGLWRRGRHNDLARLRAEDLGFVLQTGGLLPYLTLVSNIRINRRLLGMPDHDQDLQSLIEELRLDHLLHKKPHQLSIGQRQRGSIARALAHNPRLLLADEPTSALDPRLGRQVMDLLLKLVEQRHISIVLATHDLTRVGEHQLRRIHAVPLDGNGGKSGSRFG